MAPMNARCCFTLKKIWLMNVLTGAFNFLRIFPAFGRVVCRAASPDPEPEPEVAEATPRELAASEAAPGGDPPPVVAAAEPAAPLVAAAAPAAAAPVASSPSASPAAAASSSTLCTSGWPPTVEEYGNVDCPERHFYTVWASPTLPALVGVHHCRWRDIRALLPSGGLIGSDVRDCKRFEHKCQAIAYYFQRGGDAGRLVVHY